jgi:2-keto-4-pentenoate hydratase/2-oxohepta-3-ene-1,7-dioic acid hydratase in catechol pathway
MKFANLNHRLTLVCPDGSGLDVAHASNGRFPANPQLAFAKWDELCAWGQRRSSGDLEIDTSSLLAPAPRPGQIFAIGLNYVAHAAESRLDVPSTPPVFTKFASSLSGPVTEVEHPGGSVDWEVELVAVVGRAGHRIPETDAWNHIAGLMVGQDISERELQLAGSPAQFSLGKSYPGFAPTGPWLVTTDELSDPDDLELGCAINGEQVQKGRTSEMVFPVAELVARLSAVTPLSPGDLIFTGTPAGVGIGRDPKRYLSVGDELTSYVDGIGELRQTFTTSEATA